MNLIYYVNFVINYSSVGYDIIDKPSWNSDGVSAKRIQKDMLMSSVLVFEYVTTCDGSAIHLPTLSVPKLYWHARCIE